MQRLYLLRIFKLHFLHSINIHSINVMATAISIATHADPTQAFVNPLRYRLSALECHQQGRWVLVSTFNTGEILMSWGQHTETLALDIPVTRSAKDGTTTYKDTNVVTSKASVTLSLSIQALEDRGLATLTYDSKDRSSPPIPQTWTGLECELYGED
jgi:hypothetical protein